MLPKLIPRKVFFTSGVGRHREELESFEMALRDAGIEKFNLVQVSSILPPKCQIVLKEEGLKELVTGEIVFTVLSEISSNEPNRRITASIGAALPKDPERQFGYLSEHHAYGETEEYAGKYAEKLADNMYLTWTNEKAAKTLHISRSAEVEENRKWTTVIAAAVFIL